jgi:N utilization substance protein B
MAGQRRTGRVIAFQAIYSYDVHPRPLAELTDFSWLDQEGSDQSAQGAVPMPAALDFARLLIGGTLEKLEDVDRAINEQLEHWDFHRVARVDLAILRLGTYCLLYRSDIPHSVTIDEAVDIARDYSTDDAYRFVNGVLDGVRKRIDESAGCDPSKPSR